MIKSKSIELPCPPVLPSELIKKLDILEKFLLNIKKANSSVFQSSAFTSVYEVA
jgi:hypothetical protein